jgi:formimidoylglutamate deiminase
MTRIFAETVLLPEGWTSNVRLQLDGAGVITSIERNAARQEGDVNLKGKALLPAPVNLHSHGFQRALAGLTERKGSGGQDSFWTWRTLMYSFLENLTPEDTQAINAYAQMEMLQSGYSAVAEFHYTHHQVGGALYANPAEQSLRVVEAARQSGIGLTHLPVYYNQGGVDGRVLQGGQLRFKNDISQFFRVWEAAKAGIEALSSDSRIGVAPHSLRAVPKDHLDELVKAFGEKPFHIHIAEQVAEIDEIQNAYGVPPVQWLYENYDVQPGWCLVHATHLNDAEKDHLIRSRAVAGLCPLTEANLGDGIFDCVNHMDQGGVVGVGTDSNISISLAHELRVLEYSQRLNLKGRALVCEDEKSTGRTLFDAVCLGGAQAAGRTGGAIEIGNFADMMTLDVTHPDLEGLKGDTLLDSWIFGTQSDPVSDVWSAGRHMVQNGQHIHQQEIVENYRRTAAKLRSLL